MKNLFPFIVISLVFLLLISACEDVPTDSNNDEPEATTYTGIIFARYNSTNDKSVLCQINPDGTGLDTLTDTTDIVMTPDISPDGTQIVYSAGNISDSDLYLMTINDSIVVRLTNLSGRVTDPSFSPDGTRILFQFADGPLPREADIYIINTDGTGLEALTNTETDSFQYPVWSPTSSDSIFYIGVGGFVHMMNLEDHGTDLPIALGMLSPANLTFSPTDSTFLLDADINLALDSVMPNIHKGDFNWNRPIDISNPARYEEHPSWSPDGTQYVFRSYRYYYEVFSGNLYIADADGSNRVMIPGATLADTDPVWSPVE